MCYIVSMKSKFFWIFVFLAVFMLAACAAGLVSPEESLGGGGSDRYHSESGGHASPSAGKLTCGEWSDIKNYPFYLNLFKRIDSWEVDEIQRGNTFYRFRGHFGFQTLNMYTVNVISGGNPVSDAAVEVYDANDTKFAAKTDARGNAYLFPYYDLINKTITVKVTSGTYTETQSFTCTQNNLQVTLAGHAAARNVLDLMFVIDTTRSMGDELEYLKSEISNVIGTVSQSNSGYTIRLALLFYRDLQDEYVTRYFDFTTDIASQQIKLSQQSANGGDDFPEAVDRALSEAVAKNWSADYATRLIFHVCDAPPHSSQTNKTLFFNSVRLAAQKGIRIIPVASSGIDYETEYLLRQEAIMTGGTYIFLTNDSGIGDNHIEPTVGDFTVEYLNACMVRVINEYLTGIETAPVPYH